MHKLPPMSRRGRNPEVAVFHGQDELGRKTSMSLVPPPLAVPVSDDPTRRLICVVLHDEDTRASASNNMSAGQDLLVSAALAWNCRSNGGGVGLCRTSGCGICRAAATQVPRMKTATDSNQNITISTITIESLVVFLVPDRHRMPQRGGDASIPSSSTPRSRCRNLCKCASPPRSWTSHGQLPPAWWRSPRTDA